MNPSTVQAYFDQLFRAISDPFGILILVALVGMGVLVVVTRNVRWVVLAVAFYAISCGEPGSKWMTRYIFVPPLEQFRVWSRPITVGMLLLLLALLLGYDRGSRRRLLPLSFWFFIAFQLFACVRLLGSPSRDRGLLGMVTITLLTLVFGLGIGPSLQTLRNATQSIWSVVVASGMVVAGSLLQYLVNPNSVSLGKRLFGTTANPQVLGLICAFALPAMCYLFIRRKQGGWLILSFLVFALLIPLTAVMLIWTGSRTATLTALTALLVFLHRRLGRFTLAAAICLLIGVLLAPYLPDAFLGIDRLISTDNTRLSKWIPMWEAIKDRPWFGRLPDDPAFYVGDTVGEGSYLMSLSIYGFVGTFPLLLAMVFTVVELQRLWRHRKVIPELTDLVDLLAAFWAAMAVLAMFEAVLLGFLTIPILFVYFFYTVQGFLMDQYEQALAGQAQRQGQTERGELDYESVAVGVS